MRRRFLSASTFMWILTNIFIILSTIFFIPFIPSNSFWFPKNIIFILFGFSIIAITYMQEKSKSYTNKWLGIILIYIIFQFTWFFFKPLAIPTSEGKTLWNLWNYIPTINVILGILLIKIFIEYTDTLRRWVIIAKVLAWLSFGLAVYGILQYIGIDQIFCHFKWLLLTRSGKMITFFGNSRETAAFLAVVSPLCLMFKDIKYIAIYITLFIAIILTMSAIGLASFIIGFLMYLILMKKWRWAIVTILFCISGAILVNYFSENFLTFGSRFSIWKNIFTSSMNYGFTGRGLGSFSNMHYSDTATTTILGSADFEFLEIFHDGGIIMLALVICFLIGLIIRCLFLEEGILSIGYISAFFSYLTITIGGMPLRLAPFSLIGILYIASLETQYKK